MKIQSIVNNEIKKFELPSGAVTLDVIREKLGLKGTKEGCREGDCCSCMVLLGKPIAGGIQYRIVNSCLLPLGEIDRSHLVTIEGLNQEKLNRIQEFFVNEGATQCGFCTPGFIISLSGYLLIAEKFMLSDALAFISGNICRCTGYKSIERAVEKILNTLNNNHLPPHSSERRLEYLVKNNILPKYFLNISEKLAQLAALPSEPGNMPHQGKVVAGGTDLYVQKSEDFEATDIIRLNKHAALRKIESVDERLYVGAAITIAEFSENSIIGRRLPHIAEYARLIACTSIRNMGTLGGNIVNASPIGDLSIILLALDATLLIANEKHTREIKLHGFFKDYKVCDLHAGEWVQAILIPQNENAGFFNFEKVSKRSHLDIASVNSAISISLNNKLIEKVHLAAGGVAPIPKLLTKTEAFLKGEKLTPALIEKAQEIALAEIRPISDVRGSARYKSLLLKQLIKAHFEKFAELSS